MGVSVLGGLVGVVAGLAIFGCAHRDGERAAAATRPAMLTAATQAEPSVSRERGKYLVLIGGCNHCHTPGYSLPGGENIPESQWLTGVSLGWRGAWGTTYASNLRLSVSGADEQTWIATMRARNAFPPMPWASLHAMSDADLRSVYQYIKGLGPKGEAAPAYLPPGTEPKTPYLDMIPHVPAETTTRPARSER